MYYAELTWYKINRFDETYLHIAAKIHNAQFSKRLVKPQNLCVEVNEKL